MKIIYISISGNTRSFANRLADLAEAEHEKDPSAPLISLKEIDDNSPFEAENEPFFAMVPTYLEGGNGVDNGDVEILTDVLREYLDYQNNYRYCLGVIGSGNKNFNRQYCLTAKQYAEQFDFPFLADYELRGTIADLNRIYQLLRDTEQN